MSKSKASFLESMKKDYLFIRKIASRTGWEQASSNFLEFSKMRKTLEYMSKLFGKSKEFEEWLKREGLRTSVKAIKYYVDAFNNRKGLDYEFFLKELFSK